MDYFENDTKYKKRYIVKMNNSDATTYINSHTKITQILDNLDKYYEMFDNLDNQQSGGGGSNYGGSNGSNGRGGRGGNGSDDNSTKSKLTKCKKFIEVAKNSILYYKNFAEMYFNAYYQTNMYYMNVLQKLKTEKEQLENYIKNFNNYKMINSSDNINSEKIKMLETTIGFLEKLVNTKINIDFDLKKIINNKQVSEEKFNVNGNISDLNGKVIKFSDNIQLDDNNQLVSNNQTGGLVSYEEVMAKFEEVDEDVKTHSYEMVQQQKWITSKLDDLQKRMENIVNNSETIFTIKVKIEWLVNELEKRLEKPEEIEETDFKDMIEYLETIKKQVKSQSNKIPEDVARFMANLEVYAGYLESLIASSDKTINGVSSQNLDKMQSQAKELIDIINKDLKKIPIEEQKNESDNETDNKEKQETSISKIEDPLKYVEELTNELKKKDFFEGIKEFKRPAFGFTDYKNDDNNIDAIKDYKNKLMKIIKDYNIINKIKNKQFIDNLDTDQQKIFNDFFTELFTKLNDFLFETKGIEYFSHLPEPKKDPTNVFPKIYDLINNSITFIKKYPNEEIKELLKEFYDQYISKGINAKPLMDIFIPDKTEVTLNDNYMSQLSQKGGYNKYKSLLGGESELEKKYLEIMKENKPKDKTYQYIDLTFNKVQINYSKPKIYGHKINILQMLDILEETFTYFIDILNLLPDNILDQYTNELWETSFFNRYKNTTYYKNMLKFEVFQFINKTETEFNKKLLVETQLLDLKNIKVETIEKKFKINLDEKFNQEDEEENITTIIDILDNTITFYKYAIYYCSYTYTVAQASINFSADNFEINDLLDYLDSIFKSSSVTTFKNYDYNYYNETYSSVPAQTSTPVNGESGIVDSSTSNVQGGPSPTSNVQSVPGGPVSRKSKYLKNIIKQDGGNKILLKIKNKASTLQKINDDKVLPNFIDFYKDFSETLKKNKSDTINTKILITGVIKEEVNKINKLISVMLNLYNKISLKIGEKAQEIPKIHELSKPEIEEIMNEKGKEVGQKYIEEYNNKQTDFKKPCNSFTEYLDIVNGLKKSDLSGGAVEMKRPRLDPFIDTLKNVLKELNPFLMSVVFFRKVIDYYKSVSTDQIKPADISQLMNIYVNLQLIINKGINSYIQVIPLVIFTTEFPPSIYEKEDKCVFQLTYDESTEIISCKPTIKNDCDSFYDDNIKNKYVTKFNPDPNSDDNKKEIIQVHSHAAFLASNDKNGTMKMVNDDIIGLKKLTDFKEEKPDARINKVLSIMYALGPSGTGKTTRYFGKSGAANIDDQTGIVTSVIKSAFEKNKEGEKIIKVYFSYFVIYGRKKNIDTSTPEKMKKIDSLFDESLIFFDINKINEETEGTEETEKDYQSVDNKNKKYYPYKMKKSTENCDNYINFYCNLINKKLIRLKYSDVSKFIEDGNEFPTTTTDDTIIGKTFREVIETPYVLPESEETEPTTTTTTTPTPAPAPTPVPVDSQQIPNIWFKIDNNDNNDTKLSELFEKLLNQQKKIKTVLPTKNNIESSRGHTCVFLKIEEWGYSTDSFGNITEILKNTKFFPLFDMAGTENVQKISNFLKENRDPSKMVKFIKKVNDFTMNNNINKEGKINYASLEDLSAVDKIKNFINKPPVKGGKGDEPFDNFFKVLEDDNINIQENDANNFIEKIINEGYFINHTIAMLILAAMFIGKSIQSVKLIDDSDSNKQPDDKFGNCGENVFNDIQQFISPINETDEKTKVLFEKNIDYNNILSNSCIWLQIIFSFLYWNEETETSKKYLIDELKTENFFKNNMNFYYSLLSEKKTFESSITFELKLKNSLIAKKNFEVINTFLENTKVNLKTNGSDKGLDIYGDISGLLIIKDNFIVVNYNGAEPVKKNEDQLNADIKKCNNAIEDNSTQKIEIKVNTFLNDVMCDEINKYLKNYLKTPTVKGDKPIKPDDNWLIDNSFPRLLVDYNCNIIVMLNMNDTLENIVVNDNEYYINLKVNDEKIEKNKISDNSDFMKPYTEWETQYIINKIFFIKKTQPGYGYGYSKLFNKNIAEALSSFIAYVEGIQINGFELQKKENEKVEKIVSLSNEIKKNSQTVGKLIL